MPKEPITYKKAGVDTEKAGKILSDFGKYLGAQAPDPKNLSGLGSFAALYDLAPVLTGMKHPVLVSCCDGVGTKVQLAADWKETAGLGQDLVAMSVNDMLCAGALPLVFLDYYACGRIRESHLIELLHSVQKACAESECALIGGETAEMPGVYHGEDFDLAGFAVGVVDKERAFTPARVEAGNQLIALASTGLHSNGFSLVRKIVEREGLKANDKNPFDGRTWSETLLAPTQLYVKTLKPWMGSLHAAAHITGGGLYENLPRILPAKLKASLEKSQWKIPPLFEWLAEAAGIGREEILSTFNCGVGMILVAPYDKANAIVSGIRESGIEAFTLGTVTPRRSVEEPIIDWI